MYSNSICYIYDKRGILLLTANITCDSYINLSVCPSSTSPLSERSPPLSFPLYPVRPPAADLGRLVPTLHGILVYKNPSRSHPLTSQLIFVLIIYHH